MVEFEVRPQAEIVADPDEKKLIRVLIVDDELGLLGVAKQCLEMQGSFHVDTATSVEEALNKLKEKEYDSVISDYQMQGKDGLEFLEELRRSGDNIPFILFTGKGREEVAIRALNLGADRYLNKVGLPDVVYGELAFGLRYAVDKRRSLAKAAHEAMLMANVNDAVIGSDENFVITSWNRAAEEMYGWKAEEVIGKSISNPLKTEFNGTDRAEAMQTLRETGKLRADVVQYRRDGKSVYVEMTAIAIRNGKGVITEYVTVNRDVTERKKREEELSESEVKYRVLFDNSLQGIAVAIGPAPHLIFVNAALSRIWGYTPEELTTLSPQETTGLVYPEDQNIFFGCFRDRLEGKTPLSRYEFRGIRKDGTVIWLEQSATLIEYEGHPAVQATFIDITERKEALERLRILNEKIGVVGKLTRHDVRNKLSAILGNAYLAKKSLPNDRKALDYLREIESICIQTTKVLDFGAECESLGAEGLTLTDVDKAVEEALSLISELKGIKVVNNCHGLTVMADSALNLLFFNLVENSLNHGEKVSQIKILYEEGKDRLKLFYEDNGVGIPKANKPKLFDWGFTTGKGSGFGLPLIKRMMEIYGWTIEEEGEPGKGAKFVISIPKMHATMRAHNT